MGCWAWFERNIFIVLAVAATATYVVSAVWALSQPLLPLHILSGASLSVALTQVYFWKMQEETLGSGELGSNFHFLPQASGGESEEAE